MGLGSSDEHESYNPNGTLVILCIVSAVIVVACAISWVRFKVMRKNTNSDPKEQKEQTTDNNLTKCDQNNNNNGTTCNECSNKFTSHTKYRTSRHGSVTIDESITEKARKCPPPRVRPQLLPRPHVVTSSSSSTTIVRGSSRYSFSEWNERERPPRQRLRKKKSLQNVQASLGSTALHSNITNVCKDLGDGGDDVTNLQVLKREKQLQRAQMNSWDSNVHRVKADGSALPLVVVDRSSSTRMLRVRI